MENSLGVIVGKNMQTTTIQGLGFSSIPAP